MISEELIIVSHGKTFAVVNFTIERNARKTDTEAVRNSTMFTRVLFPIGKT